MENIWTSAKEVHQMIGCTETDWMSNNNKAIEIKVDYTQQSCMNKTY